jgi:hypothetical protein
VGRQLSYYNRELSTEDQRDPKMKIRLPNTTTPTRFFSAAGAATGIYAYRDKAQPQLDEPVDLGDNPSGRSFTSTPMPCRRADRPSIAFVSDKGETTLLQVIKEKNMQQGDGGHVPTLHGNGAVNGQLFIPSATASFGSSAVSRPRKFADDPALYFPFFSTNAAPAGS